MKYRKFKIIVKLKKILFKMLQKINVMKLLKVKNRNIKPKTQNKLLIMKSLIKIIKKMSS